MEFADLYRKVAVLSKRDAQLCLKEFTLNNRWKENASVIDIGCGDGSTAKEILQEYLPGSYKMILGTDISEKMIEYAKINFKSERVEFLPWDVTQELPLQMKGTFDHAFSSYVLNRVKNQRAAFINIHNLLAKGGNCLLLFLGRYTPYEVFRTLSRTQRWAEDLKDVEIFTSPYHDSQDPKKEITSLMNSVGFKEVEVKILERSHTYDNKDSFKNLIKAVNPFSVLNENWDEFMTDYFEADPNAVTVDYQLIVAYGSK